YTKKIRLSVAAFGVASAAVHGTALAALSDVKRNVSCHDRAGSDRTDLGEDPYVRNLKTRLSALEVVLGNLEQKIIKQSELLERGHEIESLVARRELLTLTTIINAAQDTILSLDKQLRITSWNRTAEQKFGYSAKEAIGQGLELIASPNQLPDMIAI